MGDGSGPTTRLPYEVRGEGRPIVLVPGGLTGWISWEPLAERLAATRRVVRVQLLNVQLGLDGVPLPDDYSRATEVAALAATLDELGLSAGVDVVGWSYGGGVALDLALARPGSVRTLTLIEPDAVWLLPPNDPAVVRQRNVHARLPRDRVGEDDLASFLLGAGLVEEGTDPRSLPQWPIWARHRQSLRGGAFWEEHADPARLPALAVPTLLVKGTGSDPLQHRVVDALAEALPRAAVAEWPGGHAVHLVSTEDFLERMRAHQA